MTIRPSVHPLDYFYELSVPRSQAQRPAHRDGRPSDRLRAQRALPVVHPRGRVRVAEGARRVPAPAGPRRRAVQLVLPLEEHRRVHQYVLLVPSVRDAARRPPAKVLQGRERVVARGGRVHEQLVAGARPRALAESAEHLRGWSPEIALWKALPPAGSPVCVRAHLRPTCCSISTRDSDSSKARALPEERLQLEEDADSSGDLDCSEFQDEKLKTLSWPSYRWDPRRRKYRAILSTAFDGCFWSGGGRVDDSAMLWGSQSDRIGGE